MPRRPRPSYRFPPSKEKAVNEPEKVFSKPKSLSKTRHVATEIDSEDSAGPAEDPSGEESEQGSNEWSEGGESDDEDDEEDADAPRVAVWEEDNEDFFTGGDVEENKIPDENRLQNDLDNLPLGALRRAQQVLKQAVADSESDSDISPDQHQIKGKEKVEWSTKPLADTGRRSKHAPVEMTAKKPVTRNRMVVDVPKIIPRDPRFLSTAGIFDPKKFQQSYGFLAENRKAELQELRESLKKARKMVASSPSALRSGREEEVERLERAMKRTESMVNRDRITRVEQEALGKRKREEVEKRKQGKGKWFLKKAEEKQVLMKARYETLAKEGGARAVKKAMEKRQKKMSQNEKRSRPITEERPSKKTRV